MWCSIFHISYPNEHHLPASTDAQWRKAVSMVPRLHTVAVECWVGVGPRDCSLIQDERECDN